MIIYVPYGKKEEYLKKWFPNDNWENIDIVELPKPRKLSLWEKILLKLKKWF